MSTCIGVRLHALRFLAVLVSALLAIGTLSTAAHAVGDPIKVCHATGGTNYVIQNPDRDSVVQPNGHAGHSGDIIPPFTYTEQIGKGKDAVFVEKYFEGERWDAEGQAIWNNGCVVPPPAPHDECPDLPGDQPAGTSCVQPEDEVSTSSSEGPADCVSGTVPVTTTTTTTTYSFDSAANEWVKSTSSSKKTVDREATVEECPPPLPHDECPDLPGDQPAGTSCVQPEDEVSTSSSEGSADCVSGTVPVTTTTTTTTYSFDSASNSWVPSTSSSKETVDREATVEECPPPAPHDECAELDGDQPAGTSCVQPEDEVSTSSSEGSADCVSGTVPVTTTTTTTTYSFDSASNTWVPSTSSSKETVDREATVEECPPPAPHDECSELEGDQPEGFECTKEDVVVKGDSVEGAPDCETGQVPVSTVTTTTTYTFDEASQLWLGSSTDTVETDYRAATVEECPPPVHDECADLAGDQPAGTSCEAPEPQVAKSSVVGEADCETGTVPVIRTIITTPYVFDVGTNKWILGAAESSTEYKARAAKASECPAESGAGGDGTGKGDEEPKGDDKPADSNGDPAVVAGAEGKTGSEVAASGVNRPAAVVLPQTGGTSDLGLLAGLALALMMAGGLIISTQRSVLRLRE